MNTNATGSWETPPAPPPSYWRELPYVLLYMGSVALRWAGRAAAGLGLFIVAMVALAAVIGTPVAVLSNHSDHVACLRLHEQTGLATRYARSGSDGECYINVDGQWVPEDRWRNIGSD